MQSFSHFGANSQILCEVQACGKEGKRPPSLTSFGGLKYMPPCAGFGQPRWWKKDMILGEDVWQDATSKFLESWDYPENE